MTKEDYVKAQYIQDKIDKVEKRNAEYDEHVDGINKYKWYVQTFPGMYDSRVGEATRGDIISDYEISKLMEYLGEIREEEIRELYGKFEEI